MSGPFYTGFQFCSQCHQGMGCGQAQKCLRAAAYQANVMTLRDKFALAAMQALISKSGACHPGDAYEMADAMLKERSK